MKISRPCYDKPHRCPGWAGGGMRYAKVSRCDGGHLPSEMYASKTWQWRTHRCTTCHLLVLPYVVRHADLRWLKYIAVRALRSVRDRIEER